MPFMYIKFIMTLLCALKFSGSFQHYYFSFQFRYEKKNRKKQQKKTVTKIRMCW